MDTDHKGKCNECRIEKTVRTMRKKDGVQIDICKNCYFKDYPQDIQKASQ